MAVFEISAILSGGARLPVLRGAQVLALMHKVEVQADTFRAHSSQNDEEGCSVPTTQQ